MSVLALLSMLAAAQGMYSSSGPVLSVSKKTFKSQILESDLPAVVEFFAPWCGHCQQLAPTYTKVANNLQVSFLPRFTPFQDEVTICSSHPMPCYIIHGPLMLDVGCDSMLNHVQGMVTVAAMDCDEEMNKKLCSKYGVKGFPTIKVIAVPE